MGRILKRISRQKVFVVFGVLLFTVMVIESQPWAEDPLSAWSYRNAVTISNPGGSPLSDFQVYLSLDSKFDFSKAKPDGSDVRFTTDDGKSLIPFWIESWNANTRTASIWIKIPSITASGAEIYFYYGNQSATSASDSASTFEFFDDFESAGRITLGYYKLGVPKTVFVQDQHWENSAPHSLSVVENNSGGYTYWGYYGLQSGDGGVGLAFSNDLQNWTKYSGNPLFFNGRWPSILKVGSIFYMLYTKDYSGHGYIKLAMSTDGVNFSDVKTVVQSQSGQHNQNPNLFYNPNDGKYYLYWFRGDYVSYWEIRARKAATPEGLDDPGSETVVLQSTKTLAAPNMLFRDGTYFLSTESDSSGQWTTTIYSSASPTSGFSVLSGSPVLDQGSACNFQTIVGDQLHNYYCKLTDGTWTLEHRLADLSAGRLEFQGEVPDSSKWTAGDGSWVGVTDTQQDGSEGTVLQCSIGSPWPQVLLSSYGGTNYVLQAYGKQVSGTVWGLGARATQGINLYSINLYSNLDYADNLYLYDWTNGQLPAVTVGQTSVGTVDSNVWYKLAVKAHDYLLDIYKDDQLKIQVSSAHHAAGGVALYGEENTVAQFNDVLVRKYAAVEPVATLNFAPAEPTLIAVALNPSSVAGGSSSQGTVTLSGPAPNGGAVVSLSDNSSAASVPASVTVSAGSTSATFTVTTTAVTSSTSSAISAVYAGVTRTAVLTVTPGRVSLTSLTLNPGSVRGGSSSRGTVTLSGPAPSDGAVVSLSDNSSVASEPSRVTIPSGGTSATFTITTVRVSYSRNVTIYARYNGVTKSAVLRVNR